MYLNFLVFLLIVSVKKIGAKKYKSNFRKVFSQLCSKVGKNPLKDRIKKFEIKSLFLWLAKYKAGWTQRSENPYYPMSNVHLGIVHS